MMRGTGARSAPRQSPASRPALVGTWVILILVAVAALEVSSLGALFLAKRIRNISYSPLPIDSISGPQAAALENLLAGRTRYLIYSRGLGWTIKPNGAAAPYRANAKGIRASREYSLTPPKHVLRIATFGDSFTHGDDVRNEDTWQDAMVRANRNLEVLNFGVPGFGLDQAFLRYQQDGAAYGPHVVLIGFYTDNVFRNVNVFRPFLYPTTTLPLAKPRYLLQGGQLVLLQNPISDLSQYRDLLTKPGRALPALAAHDAAYQSGFKVGRLDFFASVRLFRVARYRLLHRLARSAGEGDYDANSEAFRVTAAIFDRFVNTAGRHGSQAVVVMLPDGSDIKRYRMDGKKPYGLLLDYFRTKGHRYVDMLDGFQQYAADVAVSDLAPDHYSPLGNAVVAKAVWRYLEQNRLNPRF